MESDEHEQWNDHMTGNFWYDPLKKRWKHMRIISPHSKSVWFRVAYLPELVIPLKYQLLQSTRGRYKWKMKVVLAHLIQSWAACCGIDVVTFQVWECYDLHELRSFMWNNMHLPNNNVNNSEGHWPPIPVSPYTVHWWSHSWQKSNQDGVLAIVPGYP